MFVDELEIRVIGGRGGDGCISFRREKYVTKGGPDGGDGGDGGDVVLVPTVHENTLYHLTGNPNFGADKGRQGGAANCTGKGAEDLVLKVPLGTVVIDAKRGHVLKDLSVPDEPFVVARGGRGGRGNVRFASSTNRVPREYEEGLLGEERGILLSLKLIADVGLVGLPNAGKSTLLSTCSKARPRIADYPFTTLEPHLGIVPFGTDGSFVMADIPGLIEGAHEGKGLGDKFLKHVERTRVLLHLVDCSAECDDPVEDWRVIRAELAGYSTELAERPCLLVATKIEDEDSYAHARRLAAESGQQVFPISSVMQNGIAPLLDAVQALCAASTED